MLASLRSPIGVILFTVLLDMVGFGIVLPILPYYAQRFGASPLWIGALVASFSLMQFLFSPIWGRLSDRVGRRPVLLASLCGSVVSYFLFALANSLEVLLLSRLLAGIAGANISAAQAAMADLTPPARRARGMGMVGAAFGLGFTIGPILAAFGARLGPHVPGYLATALALLNLALAYLYLPESLRPGAPVKDRRGFDPRALRDILRERTLAAISLIFVATAFAASALTAMVALFFDRRFGLDASVAAWFFGLMGITIAAVQGIAVHPLVRRFGERRVILAGMAVLSLSLLLLPLSANVPALACGILLYSASVALTGPSSLSLVSVITDEHRQGEVLGMLQGLASLGRIAGPLWGGLVLGRLGIGAPFYSGGIVCGVVGLYVWRELRRD